MIDKIASWKFSEEFVSEPEHIANARRQAQELGVEPVTAGTGNQLALIAAISNARSIVEIGTGAGVSGLWLLSASDESVLTTIDDEPEYQNVAREMFKQSGIAQNRIRAITGKARAVVGNMAEEAYDLVFIDIDPNDLEAVLEAAIGLVKKGGTIVVAHALWRDRVPNPALRDEDTTSLRNVIRNLGDREEFISSLSMVGDGLLVAVKAS
ncbi:O-methyltransferase [Candidatus Aquiluna sp. UB-MaderosW2red]|uniref:O-methyltransferase n=1 Tax=Candidatus Aquiluna sp. UB-MaderosW2red TaxID=1855377 RepID=UPI000875B6A3|nr:class I SAM-dependent methyltransferase [Candidatus Aquiluna sp. UB-MaderosW2red]SCX14142.1 Predicted O-methyltransferase YrrM [Candidatus Aquiluna sp. UB-MaderosW2red]